MLDLTTLADEQLVERVGGGDASALVDLPAVPPDDESVRAAATRIRVARAVEMGNDHATGDRREFAGACRS